VFCTLKKSLSETAHLQILNQACKKILKTDASDFAVRAYLYQIKDEQKKSITYWFRKLSELKKRYKIHDKKLLAIMKALQDWRSYLVNISKPIQIFTDHKNLRNFATIKQLNQQQIHWVEQLADFKFQIHYKKNNENDDADTLNRWSDHKEVKMIHTEILCKDKKETLTKGLAATFKVKNAFLMNDKLIKVCYDSWADEHLEVKCTEDLVWRRCNISDLYNQITEYIARCDSCWHNKIQRDKHYNEVTQLNTLDVLWESVIMNFIMKLLKFKDSAWKVRFNSILIIVNKLMKYMMFISFREITTALVLMYIILWELISNHELSKKFITDRDKLFMSKFWEMLTAELRVKHKMLMIYHLQTDK